MANSFQRERQERGRKPRKEKKEEEKKRNESHHISFSIFRREIERETKKQLCLGPTLP